MLILLFDDFTPVWANPSPIITLHTQIVAVLKKEKDVTFIVNYDWI